MDGEGKGLTEDLELALADGKPALEIINTDLLEGMKTVGVLFGSGQMQLPFVLQSAEVMKTAVAYLEPHLEKTDSDGKGTIVLATVKGDVHDIGKNLVDIILTNNGYTVVNLGIKQPITTILEAADEHRADAIGMSGLLVKSTVVMRENLEEMNTRGVASYPVFLGGAALTRAYVEQDLREVYAGEVRYARDAFEGLRLMDALMAVKRGEEGAALPAPRERRVKAKTPASVTEEGPEPTTRSDVAVDIDVPTPPFWGDRIVKGIALADVAAYLDERATFMGQWGLKGSRQGPTYEELIEVEGRPRLRSWLDRIQTEGIARVRRRLRLLALLQRGQRPGGARPGRRGRGAGAAPVHLPPAAAGSPSVSGRLLPRPRAGAGEGPGRGRLPPVHHGCGGEQGHRGAVREQRLPRLPGAARAQRPADRGAGRDVARPGARPISASPPTTARSTT